VLGWSILMVAALLGGAAILAILAIRLRDEVQSVEGGLDAIATMASVSSDLADEIERTRTRRTASGGSTSRPDTGSGTANRG